MYIVKHVLCYLVYLIDHICRSILKSERYNAMCTYDKQYGTPNIMESWTWDAMLISNNQIWFGVGANACQLCHSILDSTSYTQCVLMSTSLGLMQYEYLEENSWTRVRLTNQYCHSILKSKYTTRRIAMKLIWDYAIWIFGGK